MYLVNRSWSQVQPYLDAIRMNADQERDALGFLPPIAYEEAARQGKIFVATLNGHYAGHLFFGGTFPNAKVVQLFTKPEHRGKGVGPLLIQQLESELEKLGFLSISANVAENLPANTFWENAGFHVLRTKAGGVSRGRKINVRVKDLNTPHLFRPYDRKADSELAIASRYQLPTPVYVLDLNVFWDVVRQRPRSEYARQAVAAALDNFIRMVVTTEFAQELKRTTDQTAAHDPALEFALQLPALSAPSAEIEVSIVSELKELIFPNRTKTGMLSVQDQSDLRHLATAIHHNATGFVTSEQAIVICDKEITKRFGLQIFHIKDFAETLAARQLPVGGVHVRFSGQTLKIWDLLPESSESVTNFLTSIGTANTAWNTINPFGLKTPHVKRVAVSSDSEIVCAASWDARAGLRAHCSLALVSDEEHPACEAAVDALLNHVMTDVSAFRPVAVQLELSTGAALARKAALLHGFREADLGSASKLQKVCVGRPITSSNVALLAAEIQRCSGLTLASDLPPFSSYVQRIKIFDATEAPREVELKALETLLSPTLIVLPERVGAIIPIRRPYADELLGTASQLPLLPTTEAVLFSERIYLSSSRNLHTLPEGSILFFYESGKDGGRSSVIAVARALESSLQEKRSIPETLLRRGVIRGEELEQLTPNETITVTRFDNVMVFTKPVSLNTLRALGCADGANLVTSRRIGAEHVDALLREAYRL